MGELLRRDALGAAILCLAFGEPDWDAALDRLTAPLTVPGLPPEGRVRLRRWRRVQVGCWEAVRVVELSLLMPDDLLLPALAEVESPAEPS